MAKPEAQQRVRAVQYLRMSDGRQGNSLARQHQINADYAQRHGYRIVRTYADEGVSGVSTKGRTALLALLSEVVEAPDFGAILIADVTRWGRFQNADEAGHYEFICRQAGVEVIYCGEQFTQDGGQAAQVLKGVRRAMAADYSRALSDRTRAANRRTVLAGGCLGGKAPYGFARAPLPTAPDGRPGPETAALTPATGPVRFVWGPPDEVQVIRRVFQAFTRDGQSPLEIARGLERDGMKHRDHPWTSARVGAVLDNTLATGLLTFGKSVGRLGARQKTPRSAWSRTEHVAPIISRAVFLEAASRRAERTRRVHSDDELIRSLRELRTRYGQLDLDGVTRHGLVGPSVYAARFGSLHAAFARAGQDRPVRSDRLGRGKALTWAKVAPALAKLREEKGYLSVALIDACPYVPCTRTLRRYFGPLEDVYRAVGETRTRSQRLALAQARRARRVSDARRSAGSDVSATAPELGLAGPATGDPRSLVAGAGVIGVMEETAETRARPPETRPHTSRPAAQYIRMSTRGQTTSIALQKQAIADFCRVNGFTVVQTYVDAGRSGLSVKGRDGLMDLMRDVVDDPAFSAVIVFDVSRWGRFQDPDEAAHYEFLCRSAGVSVHYCNEPVTREPTPTSALIKTLQRFLAAEYSRQRSLEARTGKAAGRRRGLWVSGNAPFGFRRASRPPDRPGLHPLARDERKPRDHVSVSIIWGPEAEVAAVRRVFSLFVEDGLSVRDVSDRMNAEDHPTRWGRDWTAGRVNRVLRNELAIGIQALGRTETVLGHTSPPRPRAMWTRHQVVEPMVEPTTFQEAQNRLGGQGPHRITDGLLLAHLRRLLADHKTLSRAIVQEAGRFSVRLYIDRFGSLQNAFGRVGFSRVARDRQHIEDLSDAEIVTRLGLILEEAGYLSASLIDRRGDVPAACTLRRRFGSLEALYRQVGYTTDRSEQLRLSWTRRRSGARDDRSAVSRGGAANAKRGRGERDA